MVSLSKSSQQLSTNSLPLLHPKTHQKGHEAGHGGHQEANAAFAGPDLQPVRRHGRLVRAAGVQQLSGPGGPTLDGQQDQGGGREAGGHQEARQPFSRLTCS